MIKQNGGGLKSDRQYKALATASSINTAVIIELTNE